MKYSVCLHAQLKQAIHKIREHVILLKTRWQYPSFRRVNTAPFPVDLLHQLIKMLREAAAQHFKQQEDG